jgi:hypothetical protein
MSEPTIDWQNRIYNGDTVEVDRINAYVPAGFRGEVVRRYATSAFTMLEVRRADGTMVDVPLIAVSKIAGVGVNPKPYPVARHGDDPRPVEARRESR